MSERFLPGPHRTCWSFCEDDLPSFIREDGQSSVIRVIETVSLVFSTVQQMADFLILLHWERGFFLCLQWEYVIQPVRQSLLWSAWILWLREFYMLMRRFEKSCLLQELCPPGWNIILLLQCFMQTPYEPLCEVSWLESDAEDWLTSSSCLCEENGLIAWSVQCSSLREVEILFLLFPWIWG